MQNHQTLLRVAVLLLTLQTLNVRHCLSHPLYVVKAACLACRHLVHTWLGELGCRPSQLRMDVLMDQWTMLYSQLLPSFLPDCHVQQHWTNAKLWPPSVATAIISPTLVHSKRCLPLLCQVNQTLWMVCVLFVWYAGASVLWCIECWRCFWPPLGKIWQVLCSSIPCDQDWFIYLFLLSSHNKYVYVHMWENAVRTLIIYQFELVYIKTIHHKKCWHIGLSRLKVLAVTFCQPFGRHELYANLIGSNPHKFRGN